MSDNLMVSGTPWEVHVAGHIPVHVKREDLCCPPPGPSFSKIRGVAARLSKMPPDTVVGVLDTVHSKAGWGVAYICAALGLTCWDFYPVYKGETGLRPIQQRARDLGAELRPLKAGRSAILYHQARRRIAEEAGKRGYMMPNALKLSETVDATARELLRHTPEDLLCGTWVVSISSGTIAAGVLKGLGHNDNLRLITHMGYSRSMDAARKYMVDMADVEPHSLAIVDEGYGYKDSVKEPCPFPCNRYYDLKAWKWLVRHSHTLRRPIVFWNIGN